jgi:hypothetical protein
VSLTCPAHKRSGYYHGCDDCIDAAAEFDDPDTARLARRRKLIAKRVSEIESRRKPTRSAAVAKVSRAHHAEATAAPIPDDE